MYLEFEDYLFNCESRGLSPKTIKNYRNNTALFLKYAEEELGINKAQDESYFIKRFKENEGITPGFYRRHFQKQDSTKYKKV